MSFLKKVTTSVARAKQVAMAKIGQAEATVDPQFNQLEASFKEQYGKMKKLTKYVESYQTAIKDLGTAQQGMSHMISDQYDSSDRMYPVAARMRDESSGAIEQYRDKMEKYYNDNFYEPIERYLTQYKILEERISERSTRLVDMDRYNAEVKSLMAKPDTVPTKLQVAKDKAEAKRVEYSQLNEELITDIQKLLADRSRFFDALFANLTQGQKDYLQGSAQSLSVLQPSFEGIDRNAVRNWPKSITDPTESAFRVSTAESVVGQAAQQQQQQSFQQNAQPQANMYQTTTNLPVQQPVGQQNAFASQTSMYQTTTAPVGQPMGATMGYPPPLYQPAPPQAKAAARAKALYPFQGQDDTELTFQAGEDIIITRQDGSDWWEGELRGRRGLFPANYVQLL